MEIILPRPWIWTAFGMNCKRIKENNFCMYSCRALKKSELDWRPLPRTNWRIPITWSRNYKIKPRAHATTATHSSTSHNHDHSCGCLIYHLIIMPECLHAYRQVYCVPTVSLFPNIASNHQMPARVCNPRRDSWWAGEWQTLSHVPDVSSLDDPFPSCLTMYVRKRPTWWVNHDIIQI